jgi:hypothetical protein
MEKNKEVDSQKKKIGGREEIKIKKRERKRKEKFEKKKKLEAQ